MARILMVAPQPFFRARGTPFSVLHRARALTRGGHEVCLATYPFGDDVPVPDLTIVRCARVPGIRDVRIGPSLAKLLLDVPLYRLTARLLARGRFDVIHSHEEAAFFCQHLARKHTVPHVYDMHSSLPQQLENFSRFNLLPTRQAFERLERYVLQRADGLITICEALAERARPVIGSIPHLMIENYCDDRVVFPAKPIAPEIDQRVGAARVVLYTGTLESYQGVDMLIDAFTRVRERASNTHLLIVGGSTEQVARLRGECVARGIGDAVTFSGTVHPAEIPGFLARADVIVSPRSSGTNTPLKIYGYLRAGKPIVATNLRTHTQTLSDAMACLVEPNPVALAAGITRVLDDAAYASRLACAAKAFADEHYSDERYVERVNGLYEAVLAGVAAPAAARAGA
jgi:glycosyltransferase involved in cell wall biosynthesis